MGTEITEEKRLNIINSVRLRKELVNKVRNIGGNFSCVDDLETNLNVSMLISSTSEIALKYYICLLTIVSVEEASLLLSVTLENISKDLPEIISFLIIRNVAEATEHNRSEKQE